MDFVPDAERLAHVFSVATGPAFFLGAVTAMLAIVLGRLKSVYDRLREIDDVADKPVKTDKELLVLYERTATLGRCINLLLSGGIFTLILLFYMTVGAAFKIERLYGAGLLFMASTGLVAAALFVFAMDVRIEMSATVPFRRTKPTTLPTSYE